MGRGAHAQQPLRRIQLAAATGTGSSITSSSSALSRSDHLSEGSSSTEKPPGGRMNNKNKAIQIQDNIKHGDHADIGSESTSSSASASSFLRTGVGASATSKGQLAAEDAAAEEAAKNLRIKMPQTEIDAYLEELYNNQENWFDYHDGLGLRRIIFPLKEGEPNPCQDSDIETPLVISGMSSVHKAGVDAVLGGEEEHSYRMVQPNDQKWLDGDNTDHRICYGGNADDTQTGHFHLPKIGGHGIQQITLRHRGGTTHSWISCHNKNGGGCANSRWGLRHEHKRETDRGEISTWITSGEGKNAVAPFNAKEDRMVKSGWNLQDMLGLQGENGWDYRGGRWRYTPAYSWDELPMVHSPKYPA